MLGYIGPCVGGNGGDFPTPTIVFTILAIIWMSLLLIVAMSEVIKKAVIQPLGLKLCRLFVGTFLLLVLAICLIATSQMVLSTACQLSPVGAFVLIYLLLSLSGGIVGHVVSSRASMKAL